MAGGCKSGAMTYDASSGVVANAQGGSPSLMQGWLPLSVEIVAAVALGCVLVRRRRCSPTRLGAALVVGLAAVLVARWALQDSGVAGEVAPGSLWVWTAATGFAATTAVSGWRAGSGWWRNSAAARDVSLSVEHRAGHQRLDRLLPERRRCLGSSDRAAPSAPDRLGCCGSNASAR